MSVLQSLQVVTMVFDTVYTPVWPICVIPGVHLPCGTQSSTVTTGGMAFTLPATQTVNE